MKIKIALLFTIFFPLLATAVESDNTIACHDVYITTGGTTNLSIGLTTSNNYTYYGYQFDIYLPTGVTLAKNGSKYLYTLDDRYNDKMQVNFNDFGSGHYRVVVFSLSNAPFSGTKGALIDLTICADGNMTGGLYVGQVKDFKLSRTDGQGETLPNKTFGITVSLFPMGDVNHDYNVNVSDVMLTVSKVLGSYYAVFYEEQGDMNFDGDITITDVMSIVDIVLH